MSQFVVMKSNRYGINLRLDPDCSFRDLLDAIIEKFQESEKFFKNAKVGISFEGRRLSTDEENRIIEEIMKHTSMEIICIIDNDKEHEEQTRQLIEQNLLREQQIRRREPGGKNHICREYCDSWSSEGKCSCRMYGRTELFCFCIEHESDPDPDWGSDREKSG